MKIIRILALLVVMAVFLTAAAYAAESNFSASSLTAKDVDCKKCHTDTPHIIHAKKPVDCVNCHGDKLSVSIPNCTKCHDGPIHQVHAGKVATQTCAYCHRNIAGVHNALTSDAVCSHCHKDLIEVHGMNDSCTKCHKSPPDIVKPLKAEGMVLICQNCHQQTSVATIHAPANEKKGCYECHGGTSKANGSEIPHTIHASKLECKGCHEENGKMVVPQCTRCHDIDALHAFNKIGKLTPQSGLNCPACHPGESKSSTTPPPNPEKTSSQPTVASQTKAASAGTANNGAAQEQQSKELKTPGFTTALAIGMLLAGYVLVRRRG